MFQIILLNPLLPEFCCFILASSSRILATGGASNNEAILQVLCDVFNCPVYTLKETSNSACLGCIYRCAQAAIGDGKQTFFDTIKDVTPHQLVCEPNKHNVDVYDKLVYRYARLEKSVAESCS